MIIVQDISQDDLEAWKANVITQIAFKAIAARRDDIKKDMGNGVYLDYDNPYRTQAKSAEASGKCEAFDEVLKVSI